MFGRNLAETVLYEQKKTGGYIPVFVERCVEFIREKGDYFFTEHENILNRMLHVHSIVCLRIVITMIFEGLSEEGLFRLPGHQKQVSILRDAFNRGISR